MTMKRIDHASIINTTSRHRFAGQFAVAALTALSITTATAQKLSPAPLDQQAPLADSVAEPPVAPPQNSAPPSPPVPAVAQPAPSSAPPPARAVPGPNGKPVGNEQGLKPNEVLLNFQNADMGAV